MGHWYDKNGDPQYTIVGANGKARDTTLRDARKLGYVPSVTTITGQLAKPWLDIWRQNILLSNSFYEKEKDQDYIVRDLRQYLDFDHFKEEVLEGYKEETEKSPKLGTEVHDELEQWYKLGANTSPGNRIAKAVFAVREQIGKNDYTAEKSFCDPRGFGGKIDLLGSGVVIDFKTKNVDDPKKMIKTFDYAMQLAAYRYGINCCNARCFNVYISTVDFNIVKVVEYTEEKLQQAWECFKCLLKFWQISNGIKPEVEYVI